ncbi:22485_t:CDS:2, partial [Racocetra persica]
MAQHIPEKTNWLADLALRKRPVCKQDQYITTKLLLEILKPRLPSNRYFNTELVSTERVGQLILDTNIQDSIQDLLINSFSNKGQKTIHTRLNKSTIPDSQSE